MSWSRVATATTAFPSNQASISLVTTLTILAGDTLVIDFGASTPRPTGINISDGTNTWTALPLALGPTNANANVYTLYVLSSAALTNPTFVATNSGGGNIVGYGQFSIHQFRAPSGSVVSLDGTPVATYIAANTTLTTGSLTTTGSDVLTCLALDAWIGVSLSSVTIGGNTANISGATSGTLFTPVGWLSQTSPGTQSAVATYSGSAEIAGLLFAFKAVPSTVNQTITCTGITLGGSSTSQEVFVGGIG